jgi:hypothetical protein
MAVVERIHLQTTTIKVLLPHPDQTKFIWQINIKGSAFDEKRGIAWAVFGRMPVISMSPAHPMQSAILLRQAVAAAITMYHLLGI